MRGPNYHKAVLPGPRGYKPKNLPAQPVTTVPCPDCKAPAGEPCVTSTGTKSNRGHNSRRRMAVRARNEVISNVE